MWAVWRGPVAAAAAVLAGLLGAAFALLMTTRPLAPEIGAALAYGVLTATALAACVVLALRSRGLSAGLSRARKLMAVSLLATVLAGVLAIVLPQGADDLLRVQPRDLVHLSFLPLAVAGLLHYPQSGEPGGRWRSLLDGALASGGLWLLVDVVVLQPADATAGLRPSEAFAVLVYPAADVFVVGTALSLLGRVLPACRRELALWAGGLFLYSTADVAISGAASAGGYRPDGPVSLVAELGVLVVLLGAALAVREPAPATGPVTRRWSWGGGLVPATVLLGVLVLTARALSGDVLAGPPLVLLFALVLLLMLRQELVTRDRTALGVQLQRREELFRSLVTSSSDLITLHDARGRLTYASPAVTRATGRGATELELLGLSALLHPQDLPVVAAARDRLTADPAQTVELLFRVRTPDVRWRWYESHVRNLLADPAVQGLIANTRDVHERHMLEQQVRYAAYHDALTGLGNLARARQLLDGCFAGPRQASVVLVDLDGFKQVNDTWGHAAGDALLVSVAGRLLECVREGDEVIRIGGDEFLLILCEDLDDAAVPLAHRVLTSLTDRAGDDGAPLGVGASLGTASTRDARDPEELLRHADRAMYAAKRAGRGQVVAYRPGLAAGTPLTPARRPAPA